MHTCRFSIFNVWLFIPFFVFPLSCQKDSAPLPPTSLVPQISAPVKKQEPVLATLQVRLVPSAPNRTELYVDLTLTNQSSDSVYLDPIYVESHLSSNGRFTITTSDGKEVKYIGQTAKRMTTPPEQWIELRLGESKQFSIRLDEKYQFLPGKKSYQVVAHLPVFTKQKEESMILLDTPAVSFVYEKIEGNM